MLNNMAKKKVTEQGTIAYLTCNVKGLEMVNGTITGKVKMFLKGQCVLRFSDERLVANDGRVLSMQTSLSR
jgi:hypothetical protein